MARPTKKRKTVKRTGKEEREFYDSQGIPRPAVKKRIEYNPDYHDAWGWSLAMKGATDAEIAASFGISVTTLQKWTKKEDETGQIVPSSLGEAISTGKEVADAQVEKKLYEKCIGFTLEDRQQIINVDKDGKSKVGQVRVTKRQIPPDTNAIMYWLNNRMRYTGEWAMRQDVNLSVEKVEEGVVVYIPDNGRDVIEEDRDTSTSGAAGGVPEIDG